MSRAQRSWLLTILTAGAALLAPWPGLAAAPWTAFGPGGGSVLSLAVDPGNPGLVYAVAGAPYFAPYGTLYRSTDGGATWAALAGPGLRAVAVDPAHPATIYAGGSQLLRSLDGGLTWTDVTLPPAGGLHDITALALTPGGVVFASDGTTLLRSADGGGTWSAVPTPSSGFSQLTIQVSPSDPSHVYVASWQAISVSGDGGVSFTLAAKPSTRVEQPLGGFALAPSAPGVLYTMFVQGSTIYRSDDGAATWRTAGSLPVGSTGFQVLQVDPQNADRIYAGTAAGLFRSTDGGKTWARSDAGLPRPAGQSLPVLSFAAAPSRPDSVYAGTIDWGVARSRSAGEHWQIGLENGLNAAAGLLLRFSRPDTAYLASGGGARSFRSADGGQTWQPFARDVTQDGLSDLAWVPGHPEILYALNGKGLWTSLDEGVTWKLVTARTAHVLAVLDRSTLLSDGSCGLYRSGSGGRTWRRVLSCQVNAEDTATFQSLRVDPGNPNNVYAYALVGNGSSHFGFGAYRSRDGGAHWKALQVVLSSFAVAPSDFQVLYAIDPVQTRLLRSADGGDHWSVASPSLPAGVDRYFASLAVDGGDPDTVYLGSPSGVYVSHDAGATFTLIDAPFEAGKRQPVGLQTDRNRPGRVYAVPIAGGLFEGRFE